MENLPDGVPVEVGYPGEILLIPALFFDQFRDFERQFGAVGPVRHRTISCGRVSIES
jgi:hypothetical protein